MIVKYVEQGDSVKIVEGKYQGETGLVMKVDPNNVTKPNVRIDSTQRECQLSTNHLKLIKPRDKDDIKAKSGGRNGGKPSELELGA